MEKIPLNIEIDGEKYNVWYRVEYNIDKPPKYIMEYKGKQIESGSFDAVAERVKRIIRNSIG